jgi:hypothetical protein
MLQITSLVSSSISLAIVFSVPQFNTMPTTSIWDISTTHTPDPEPTESKSETDPTPYRTALLTSPTPPEESITVPEVASSSRGKYFSFLFLCSHCFFFCLYAYCVSFCLCSYCVSCLYSYCVSFCLCSYCVSCLCS